MPPPTARPGCGSDGASRAAGEAEGNVVEQKRVIVDRLVRWATRDGGDSSQVAAAIRAVLDEYLPGA